MAPSAMVLRYTREQILEVIAERRPVAEAIDLRRLAEHKNAEKEFLKRFRAACREAAKWDYDTAKANHFTPAFDRHRGRPECPRSLVASLDKHVNLIRMSRQKTFIIGESGQWSALYHALTFDPDATPEMC